MAPDGAAVPDQIALALGHDLTSLEVNPLLFSGTTIEALDAVVTWKDHA